MASARKHPVKLALEELEQAIVSHQEAVTANLQIIFDAYDNAMSAIKNAMAGQVATPQAPPEPVARPQRQERPATPAPAPAPAPVETAAEPVKRGRGRPPRNTAAQPVAGPVAVPAGRGRPRAVPVPVEEPEDETDFVDEEFQDDDTTASTSDDSDWGDEFLEDDDDIPEPQSARGRRGR